MKNLQRFNPGPGLADFLKEFRRPTPYRWPVLLLSAAATIGLFSVMWQEGAEGPPARPEVFFITTFAPDRTDEEIMASNIANQKIKDRLAAEQARRDAEVKAIYRKLGRMSGMDVDKIEREAAATQSAEQQAEEKQQAELWGKQVERE